MSFLSTTPLTGSFAAADSAVTQATLMAAAVKETITAAAEIVLVVEGSWSSLDFFRLLRLPDGRPGPCRLGGKGFSGESGG